MKKLYTIKSTGYIAALDMQGPVSTPVRMQEYKAIDLMKNGFEVYEHNPVYPKEKVLLTQSNYKNIEFKTTRKMAALERVQEKAAAATVVTPKNKKYSEEDKKKPEKVNSDDVVVVKKKEDKKDENKVRPDDFSKM